MTLTFTQTYHTYRFCGHGRLWSARLALLNSAYDVAYFNGRIDTILERN